jgi:hypothetical protein
MQIESNRDAAFEEFAAAGEVEVGDANAGVDTAEGDDEKEKKPAVKRGPPKPAPKPAAADDAGDDEDQGVDDEGGDEDDEQPKPKKTAAEHQIDRLKREKRELQKQLREGPGSSELARRLEAVETRLTGGNTGDTKTAAKPAPDPSDAEKYPLGHLDDRYIEDKLDWLAEQKATKMADSVLQREQEKERDAAIRSHQEALLNVVNGIAAKGSELYDDFQETVVDAGMNGDYDLSQPTFEACAEADNGAQILYDLSQDTKEASRVAKLTPYGQLKYVQERDAEIATGKRGRTKPGAGEPPKNQARGTKSSTQINPATDNLNDFEKAWKRDEEKNK